MKVNGKVYYHIHTINKFTTKWETGKKLTFSNEQMNRIFPARFAKLEEDIKAESTTDYLNENIKLFKKVQNFLIKEAGFVDIMDYIGDSQKLMIDLLLRAKGMQKIILSHNHLLTELIFEQVRSKQYTELPSRLKCAWLCDKRNIKKWIRLFENRGKYKVFEVRAFGEVCKVDRSWLPIHIATGSEIIDKANNYWKGKLNPIVKKRQIEYLFKGHIEIIKELSEFHRTNKK